MDTILGRRPVNAKPIKNERLRVTLAIFVAKVRLGWTVANYHQQVRGPIDEEHAWQRLDAKIARLAPRETGDFPAGSRAAVLKVRIHLPPADSPCLAGYSPPTSKSRAFPAGVRGGAGSAVGRDGCGAVIRRRRAAISLAGRIPVPQRG